MFKDLDNKSEVKEIRFTERNIVQCINTIPCLVDKIVIVEKIKISYVKNELWIEGMANGRSFVFQLDSSNSHIVHVIKEWLTENFYDYVTRTRGWFPYTSD